MSTPHEALVFVKEFGTYAKNFKDNKTPVSAIDVSCILYPVSCCHLLEIINKETGNRTAFSLTHFTVWQLKDVKATQESLAIIFNEFKKVGGKLSTAQVRIFGGEIFPLASAYPPNRNKGLELRENLCGALLNSGISASQISKPEGHWMRAFGQTADYVFLEKTIEFRKVIDQNDISKDEYSRNTSPEMFSNRQDQAYYSVSAKLDGQTSKRNQAYKDSGDRNLLVSSVVGRDGIFLPTPSLPLFETTTKQSLSDLSSGAVGKEAVPSLAASASASAAVALTTTAPASPPVLSLS